jgi:hypothetical protein
MMARLSSFCGGGTPGRPGDKVKGIAPRLPRPPKPPTSPAPPHIVGQEKPISRDDQTGEDRDGDSQPDHPQG